LVEKGEIDRVLAKDGEEEIVEGIKAIKWIDGIKVIEEVEAVISSRTDPDFIDLSNKKSIINMAIIVLIFTIYRIAINNLLKDWQIY
jgi:hypothetical protein